MDLSQKIYTVQLPPKSKIIKEGQEGDSFFILLQGEVEVAHNAAVTAEEDTTVIAFSKEEFDLLLSASSLDHVLADDSRKDLPDNWFFLMSGKSWNMNRSIVKGHLTTR